jgi:hypothetical protein
MTRKAEIAAERVASESRKGGANISPLVGRAAEIVEEKEEEEVIGKRRERDGRGRVEKSLRVDLSAILPSSTLREENAISSPGRGRESQEEGDHKNENIKQTSLVCFAFSTFWL